MLINHAEITNFKCIGKNCSFKTEGTFSNINVIQRCMRLLATFLSLTYCNLIGKHSVA